jgi:hypothetical protein
MITSRDNQAIEANRINDGARSLKLGWELALRDAASTRGMLDDWHIVSLDAGGLGTDREATEFVVEQAWAEGDDGIEDGLHKAALGFLHQYAPESYVRAIYIGHHTPMPADIAV